MSFLDLGIEPAIVYQLKKQGITEPFEVQEAAIPDTMLGKDVCCRAPTGSGKTLAFGLPLIARCKPSEPGKPSSLIVTPTRELAEQICNVLTPLAKEMHLKVLAVYGGTSYTKHRRALEKGVDIVVACPGRLIDLMEQGSISLENVEIAVLDEADRMADMGFIDPVCFILDNCDKNRQVILYSATLDREVSKIVKKYQNSPARIEVGPKEISMDSMKHHFWIIKKRKIIITSDVIEKVGRTMIFCRTRRGVDRVTSELKDERLRATAIHGGLTQRQRDRAMDQFIYGDCIALVATDVAARGIDVDGVQCVIHWDPPENGKAYKHRSGRTARAGATGTIVSLLQKKDKSKYKRIQKEVGINVGITDPILRKIPENELDYIPPPRKKREYQPKNPRNRRRNRRRRRPPSGKSDEPKKFGGKNKKPKRTIKLNFHERKIDQKEENNLVILIEAEESLQKRRIKIEKNHGKEEIMIEGVEIIEIDAVLGRKLITIKEIIPPKQNRRKGKINVSRVKSSLTIRKKPSKNKKRDNKSQKKRNSKKKFFSSKRKR